MNKRMQILVLLGLWSAAALSPAARADGSLNTTRPAQPQQPAPADSSIYVYGAGTVYTPCTVRKPAGAYRDERRQYRARDRAVIEYSRDGGRDGYLLYRRNLERRGGGYRDEGRRRHEDRRDYDGRRYGSRDSYRDGRDRGNRHGRDKESCLGSHCYDESSSTDGKRDTDRRRE